MKKNIILIIFVLIILAGAGIWYINKGNKSPAPSQPPSLVAQATYFCNGNKTINAAFYKGEVKPVKPGQPPIPSGSVKLVLSDGRNFDLPQTISADGSRYVNGDESFVFWSKGDGALVLENNVEKNYTGCTTKNPTADWKTYQDQQNGVSFQYPETFGANVWRTQSWPPKLTVVPIGQDPVQVGCPDVYSDLANSVKQYIVINNLNYSFWRNDSPGAGSLYTGYCYVTQKNQKYYVLYFVIWSHLECGNGSCGAYCGTQFENECRQLDRVKDIDQPIQLIVSTLKIK